VTRQACSVVIAVADNGVGLDSALLPHVFELFTQAERSPDRAQGGLASAWHWCAISSPCMAAR